MVTPVACTISIKLLADSCSGFYSASWILFWIQKLLRAPEAERQVQVHPLPMVPPCTLIHLPQLIQRVAPTWGKAHCRVSPAAVSPCWLLNVNFSKKREPGSSHHDLEQNLQLRLEPDHQSESKNTTPNRHSGMTNTMAHIYV